MRSEIPVGMTPEALRHHEESLRSVGLPLDTVLVVWGNGKVRHIAGGSRVRRNRGVTWCNMFYQGGPGNLRNVVEDWHPGDEVKPICAACTRTLLADLARARNDDDAEQA